MIKDLVRFVKINAKNKVKDKSFNKEKGLLHKKYPVITKKPKIKNGVSPLSMILGIPNNKSPPPTTAEKKLHPSQAIEVGANKIRIFFITKKNISSRTNRNKFLIVKHLE